MFAFLWQFSRLTKEVPKDNHAIVLAIHNAHALYVYALLGLQRSLSRMWNLNFNLSFKLEDRTGRPPCAPLGRCTYTGPPRRTWVGYVRLSPVPSSFELPKTWWLPRLEDAWFTSGINEATRRLGTMAPNFIALVSQYFWGRHLFFWSLFTFFSYPWSLFSCPLCTTTKIHCS